MNYEDEVNKAWNNGLDFDEMIKQLQVTNLITYARLLSAWGKKMRKEKSNLK